MSEAPQNPWEDIEAELLKAIGYPRVTVADLPPNTFVSRFFTALAAERQQQAERLAALEQQLAVQRETMERALRRIIPVTQGHGIGLAYEAADILAAALTAGKDTPT